MRLCGLEYCSNKHVAKGLCKKHYYRKEKHGTPRPGNTRRVPLEYKVNSDDCYIVTSHKAGVNGYVLIRSEHGQIGAHRKVYIDNFGSIPKDLIVRHKCDTPKCINPKHLEVGTHNDNSKDRVKRNRQAKGTLIKTSKLTEKEVLEIRALEHYYNTVELAKLYGVYNGTIGRILKRKTWKHI